MASRSLTDAAIEWLDFTNESGPIPWEPGDYPGTSLTQWTSGGDNYYNNDMYGAYANYGMAIATPFLVSPVYNLDGTPMFAHNMTRGVHAAIAGAIGNDVDWRLMYSYQQGYDSAFGGVVGYAPQSVPSVEFSEAGAIVPRILHLCLPIT